MGYRRQAQKEFPAFMRQEQAAQAAAKATAPQSISAPSIVRIISVHRGFSTDIPSIKTSLIIYSSEQVVWAFLLLFVVLFVALGFFYCNFPPTSCHCTYPDLLPGIAGISNRNCLKTQSCITTCPRTPWQLCL